MDKKIKYMICAFCLILVIGIGGNIYAQQSGVSIMKNWGAILNKNFNNTKASDSEEVYAKGKNGVVLVSDIKQAKEFYLLSGMNEEEAEQEAVDYAYKREALYQSAIANGYSVTDKEIWDYLNELKEFAKTVGNKEEAEAVMKQFSSEDAYWDFQFTVYQKNLPIQNYVKDLEKKFMETEQYSVENEDLQTGWNEKLEEIKTELVAEEDFEMIP